MRCSRCWGSESVDVAETTDGHWKAISLLSSVAFTLPHIVRHGAHDQIVQALSPLFSMGRSLGTRLGQHLFALQISIQLLVGPLVFLKIFPLQIH